MKQIHNVPDSGKAILSTAKNKKRWLVDLARCAYKMRSSDLANQKPNLLMDHSEELFTREIENKVQ